METGALYNAVLTLSSGEKKTYTRLTHVGIEHEEESEINLFAFHQHDKSELMYVDPGFISDWEFTKIGYAYNVWHVWSGLDAFIVRKNNQEIYLPYIPVIASTPEKAREKVAAILGMKLDDQNSNPNYENYIDWAEFKYVHSS